MTRVTGIGVEDRRNRRRVTHVDTDRGRIACEVVVNAGGIFAHEIGRMVDVNVPIVPMAHQYALTRPRQEVPKDLPTMRAPDRLVYFREEVGGLVVGGYEREPEPWCVDGDVPPTFNNTPAPARLGPFPAPDRGGVDAGALPRRRRGHPARQRPGGLHAGRRVHPGRERGDRVLRGRRVLCPRHRRRGRQRPGDGGVDRRRRAPDGPVEDGHSSVRRAVPRPRLRPRPHLRGVQHVLRHRVPAPRAAGRAAVAPAAGVHEACRPRRGVGGEGRVGAGQLVLVQRRPGPRGAASSGLGGPELVDGHRDRAPGLPAHGRPVRRVQLRQDRGHGPRCDAVPATPVRQRRRSAAGIGHLHVDVELPGWDRVRLHRHPPGGGPLPHRHRHRLRSPRPVVDPQPPAGRGGGGGRGRQGRDVVDGLPRPVGPAGPGRPVRGLRG